MVGLEVLFWIWVLTWMTKTAATDVLHAVKGTPNPRYELKRQRAAAGRPVKGQPRYGTREWAADLYSDALAAHTERRRQAAKAKARPVDDMVELVREPWRVPEQRTADRHPHDPNNTRNCPTCKGEVVLDGRPCPRCLAEQERRNAEWEAELSKSRPLGDIGEEDWCEQHQVRRMRQGVTERGPRSQLCPCPPRVSFVPPETPEDEGLDVRIAAAQERQPDGRNPHVDYADQRFTCDGCGQERYPAGRKEIAGQGVLCQYCQRYGADEVRAMRPDTRPDAQIIQFPNPKNIEKEIIMANSEVTGLSTAIAFAEQAATAHTSFATTGAEGYVGALEQGGNGGDVIGTAREAMEASGIAADKWAAHRAKLEEQLNLKEAHQSQPDAGDKQFLLNG